MPDTITMSDERWQQTGAYIREVFCATDHGHAGVMARAIAAGLPAIDAGPDTGKFLQMLVMLTGGRLVIEVGTLAGYSAIWMARGLGQGGRVITVEASAKHAEIARAEIDAAGVGNRVVIRQGKGGEVLPALRKELGAGKADLIFLDAERSEYLTVLDTVHALLRPGGVLAIDNALSAQRWVSDPYGPGQAIDTMDKVDRAIAADKRFISTVVPVGNGVLVGVKI